MQDATSVYQRAPLLLLGASLLLLSACASTPPPTMELERARAALVRAEQANADTHAPVDYRMAREGLQQAQTLMDQRKHEPAQRALQRAEARAELAASKGVGARLRAEVKAKEDENTALRRELLGGGQRP